MTIATIVTYLIQTYVLVPLEITYLQTITYILIIAALVQMVEIILKKVSPALYQALGVFLPLITTNCAILGVAILVIQNEFNLIESVVFAISNAIGFGLALVIFAGLREHMDLIDLPKRNERCSGFFGDRRIAFYGIYGICRFSLEHQFLLRTCLTQEGLVDL